MINLPSSAATKPSSSYRSCLCLSSIHEKANCIAIFRTGRLHSLGSCHFSNVWATCLPYKGGGIPLSALPKDTTIELAGLFSTTSPKCRAPSRESVDTIFKVFWYDSTRGMIPGLPTAKQTLQPQHLLFYSLIYNFNGIVNNMKASFVSIIDFIRSKGVFFGNLCQIVMKNFASIFIERSRTENGSSLRFMNRQKFLFINSFEP